MSINPLTQEYPEDIRNFFNELDEMKNTSSATLPKDDFFEEYQEKQAEQQQKFKDLVESVKEIKTYLQGFNDASEKYNLNKELISLTNKLEKAKFANKLLASENNMLRKKYRIMEKN